MGDFKHLIAWQKAHAFGLAVHAAFKGREAHFSPGFRAQILRAVNSIADNLAEGCAKRSRRELARYADDAYASSKEVENDLIRARDLAMLERSLAEDLLRQGDEVSRLCFGLARPRPRSDDDPWPRELEV
jgi:four helix bundle protein